MNLYKFINSKDVRKYMEELHYQFSILEAAFVIYHSKQVTLQEKIDAWLELTDTMPDCSITRQRGRFCIESLHEYLKCYIEFQKQSLEAFYDHKSCVYCYEIHEILCKGYFYSETEEAKKEERNPFRLCWINTWDTDKKINCLLQDGDLTDMGFSAYYLEKEGVNLHLHWNHGEYYLALEYYENDFCL